MNSYHVITAGHCTQYKRACSGIYASQRKDYAVHQIAVRVGAHNLRLHQDNLEEMIHVKRITRHPDYEYKEGVEIKNDIAILELWWPVDVMIHTPACLARRFAGRKFDGKMAKAVGWGRKIEIQAQGQSLIDQFSRENPLEVDLEVDPLDPRDEDSSSFVQVKRQSGKGTCMVRKSSNFYKITHYCICRGTVEDPSHTSKETNISSLGSPVMERGHWERSVAPPQTLPGSPTTGSGLTRTFYMRMRRSSSVMTMRQMKVLMSCD